MFPLESQLVKQVKENLCMHMLEDAVFYAERLNASFVSDENIGLLAECYLRSNEPQRVIQLLAGSSNKQNRYLCALAAMKLNQLDIAEKALAPDENAQVPNSAHGYYLLGRIARLKNKPDSAAQFFREALSRRPELWSAYRELCEMGHAEHPNKEIQYDLTVDKSTADVFRTPYSQISDNVNNSNHDTSNAVDSHASRIQDIFQTPNRSVIHPGGPENGGEMAMYVEGASTTSRKVIKMSRGEDSPGFKRGEDHSQVVSQDKQQNTAFVEREEGRIQLVKLLRSLGLGYYYLCQHMSQDSIKAFRNLPEQQFSTAWVMTQIGRAHYEALEYRQAITSFDKAQRLDPSNVHGLEYYSTVLWLAGDEVKLSILSQHAVNTDRLAPETWCVLGNCFSLQKDHATAIKYFQRALQLDTNFGYAYTLLGHEYFAVENHEKAQICFRNAMLKDTQSYNAWFGLGCIYYREEKYDFAYYHLQAARRLNKFSSVICCYLGMTQNKQKKYEEALKSFQEAQELDPCNPLPRHEKAVLLSERGEINSAIHEFETLREMLPQEASTCLHLGRLYKKVNKLDLAVTRLQEAMDLTHSNTEGNLIKAVLEKIHVMDVDEQPDL
eukprot:TRINITY_DN1490_c1_g1_i3.p1 TRINITY_DN1490_c1_g1~~TRINITY_DN1490_c1_g1_i3.p1  ORF type:complete len:610 (+),score=74.59 TRINITY_DN1490_c1_g1_i3:411-2240(+)